MKNLKVLTLQGEWSRWHETFSLLY